MPCLCGQVHIGNTKLSMTTRITEHSRYCRLGQPEKSALAEPDLANSAHAVLFEEKKLLASSRHYFARLGRGDYNF